MLNILDEKPSECLVIQMDQKLISQNDLDVLTDLFIIKGFPGYIRSDNGPELVVQLVRNWILAVEAKTVYVGHGSTWRKRLLRKL